MLDFTECRCGYPLLKPETTCRECKVLDNVSDNSDYRKSLHLKALFKARQQPSHSMMLEHLRKVDVPTESVQILMAENVQAVRGRRRAWKSATLIDRLQDDA